MKPFHTLGAVLALSFAAATPANAATIVITVEGTLSYGYDNYNTLGLGTDLTGQSVSMFFRFDDETPGTYYNGTDDYQYIWGYGPDYGGGWDSSPGMAAVTVGGVGMGIWGDYHSAHSRTALYGVDDGWDTVATSVTDIKYVYNSEGEVIAYTSASAGITANGPNLLGSADLRQNLDFSLAPDVSLSSTFRYYSWDYINQAVSMDVYGHLDPESISYSARASGAPIGAVPEPATWALMILGFGAVGAVMRRARPMNRAAVRA